MYEIREPRTDGGAEEKERGKVGGLGKKVVQCPPIL